MEANTFKHPMHEKHPLILLAQLCLFGFLFMFIFMLLGAGVCAFSFGMDFQDAINISGLMNLENGGLILKIENGFTLLGALIIGPYLFKLIYSNADYNQFVSLKPDLNWKHLLIASLGIVALSFPVEYLVDVTKWIEQFLPKSVSDWMHSSSADLEETYAKTLAVKGPLDMVISLLTMALIPAIGEETVFRGAISFQLKRMNVGMHGRVLITAALFSAFHMQPEMFLSRMVMGMFLGYLFEKTGRLSNSVWAHFLNNALAIIVG